MHNKHATMYMFHPLPLVMDNELNCGGYLRLLTNACVSIFSRPFNIKEESEVLGSSVKLKS